MPVLPIKIRFEKIHPDAKLPTRGSEGAAGFDLYSVEDVVCIRGGWAVISTGLKIAIPEGYEGQVRSRSGLAAKEGVFVLNSPGTIDADYRGEIKVILGSILPGPSRGALGQYFTVSKGDRIAQLVIKPVLPNVMMCEVDSINEDETSRGSNGFGSTGQ